MNVRVTSRVRSRTQAVIAANTNHAHNILVQVGKEAKQHLKNLMPYSSLSAKPGSAPRAHVGGLRNNIVVEVLVRTLKVSVRAVHSWSQKWYLITVPHRYLGKKVMVPVEQKIAPARLSVPGLLEGGGVALRQRRYKSGRIYSTRLKYDKFPFIAPTKRFAVRRVKQLIKAGGK